MLAGPILMASIPILIKIYLEKYRQQDFEQSFPNEPADFGLPVPETFDFIVVGGGTAGCVVASRLSEKYSVLLLEAGGIRFALKLNHWVEWNVGALLRSHKVRCAVELLHSIPPKGTPPPLQDVPLTFHLTMDLPGINFLYKSIPQKNAALANGGVIVTTAGKMLGGCSSHNGMMYVRGHPRDFDQWATESGDDSWKYENVLKFFKKGEKYTGKNQMTKDQHGTDGPVSTLEDEWAPGGQIWLNAGKELGYKVIDANGPQTVGFSATTFTKLNGRRHSTYSAYIKPIEKKRKTLITIYRYSYVSEVIFDEKKTAIGVRYQRHGVERAAFARKEVILSAGSYISPLILIKSGIGPLDQLEAAKVKPISILPVGHNLMDHPLFVIRPIFVDKPELAFNLQANLTFQHVQDFVEKGAGPLTGVFQGPHIAVIASSRNSAAKGLADWPNLMLFYSYFDTVEPLAISGLVGVNGLRTRGTIKLNTSATSMEDDNLPIIDFKYFDDESDVDVAVEGIKFFLNVIENTTAFKQIGARYAEKAVPNCESVPFRSDAYWKCYVRQRTGTTWHPTGTCRMGKGATDPKAVVDSKLRVIGVKNLRVADASIIPVMTNANTMTPVIMIGEKAADDIIQDHANDGGPGSGPWT